MKEDQLYEQIAQYLNLKYPALKYHFDLSGMWTPSHKARNLYGRLNSRAWPDLLIAESALIPDTTIARYGLFIEIKRDGTRIRKRNGEWASDHIAEQADVLASLQRAGYVAQFAVGFDDCITIIESYLEGTIQSPQRQAA